MTFPYRTHFFVKMRWIEKSTNENRGETKKHFVSPSFQHGCQESKWPTRGLISFLKIGRERKKPHPLAATLPLLCCGLLRAPERGRMRVPLWLLWMSWLRWMCWWSCAGWPHSVGCWEQTSPHSCPPYPALKHKATEDISDWDLNNKTTPTHQQLLTAFTHNEAFLIQNYCLLNSVGQICGGKYHTVCSAFHRIPGRPNIFAKRTTRHNVPQCKVVDVTFQYDEWTKVI